MESKDTSNLYNIENAFCLLMDNEIDDNNQLNDEILSDKYNDELTNDELTDDESNDDSNEDELPNEENLNDYESDQDIVVLSNYNGKTYFQEKIKIDKKQTWKKNTAIATRKLLTKLDSSS